MKYAIRQRILRTDPPPEGRTDPPPEGQGVDGGHEDHEPRGQAVRAEPGAERGGPRLDTAPAERRQRTDTGEIHEQRDLKGRAEGETRSVPGIRP